MASPLRLFRKYEYVFLVAFGIMLMIAFVVGPILSDYLDSRMRGGGGEDSVVVTWAGGELHESDLGTMRAVHGAATRFLRELTSQAEVTEDGVIVNVANQDVELIKGRRYPLNQVTRDANGEMVLEIAVGGELVSVPFQSAQVISPKAELISPAADEQDLVRRLILAEWAKQQGVIVGEGAVLDYLDRLADVLPDDRPDYAAWLARSTGGRLNMPQFVEQMQIELAAQRMMIMSQSGHWAFPPDVLYNYYNRLNRRVTADLLAVDVAGFTDQVKAPSEPEVVALYEEGKNRFPYPSSPEPGFKRREKIAFGYFKGSFNEFLQREIDQISPTITDAEIEEYYNKNKDIQYTVPDLPPAEPSAPPQSEETTTDTPQAAPPQTEQSAPEQPAPEQPVPEQPAPEQPAPAESAGEATPSEPATPPVDPADSPAPQPPAGDPSAEPPTGEPPAGEPQEGGQVQMPRALDVMFVNFQEPSSEPAAEPAPAPDPAPAESTTPAPQPVPAPGAESPPAQPPAQEPSSETPPQTEPNAPSAGQEVPAETTPAEATLTAPSGGEAAAGAKEEPKKEVKYKPLDDALRAQIRQELARTRARTPAEEKLQKAINAVEIVIDSYAKQLNRSKELEGFAAPQPLDFAALATEHQLTYQQTPLLDELDVFAIVQRDPADGDPAYYEFVRAEERTLSRDGRGIERRSILDLGFTGPQELMIPRRMVDGINAPDMFQMPPENLYLFWRTEEQPEAVPTLEEVRSEVVQAWKLREAVPLAQAKAQEMAQQAQEAGKPLAEVFPESATKVIRTTPFSWMTRGAVPMGSGGSPVLSPVRGTADNQPVSLAGIGADFMKSVFSLDVGKVGTATDQPERFVYVVRIDSEELTDDQRREAFFASGYSQDVHALVVAEQGVMFREWFDNVEKELQVDWVRDPESNWRVE